MKPTATAHSPRGARPWLAGALLWCCSPSARAQDVGSDVYVVTGSDPVARAALEARARNWLETHHRSAASLASLSFGSDGAAVPASELAVLDAVERALTEARELLARFDERAALTRLHEAEQLLLGALQIPHAERWLSEVELQLGLCAAQRGDLGLAETALTRAFSLDPERTVQAAEAPPWLVQLAHSVRRRRAEAGFSTFRVEVEPAAARIDLDGRDRGRAPVVLTMPAGTHLLTARAPGHRPYATLLELSPGERIPVQIQLAPVPADAARQALQRAAEGDHAGADPAWSAPAETLSALLGRTVWVFPAHDRELPARDVYRCDPHCLPVASGAPWLVAEHAPAATKEADHPPPPTEPKRAWWRRWPFWTVASVAVVGGVLGGVLGTRGGKPHQERELTLDPGQLPP